MAHRGGFKPGSLSARYEALTQDADTYYAFARHMGWKPSEVDDLKWWEHDMLVEEMRAEFSETPEGAEETLPSTEPDESDVTGAGHLASLGVQIRNIQS